MTGVVHVTADSEYAKNGLTDIGECACKARVPAHAWLGHQRLGHQQVHTSSSWAVEEVAIAMPARRRGAYKSYHRFTTLFIVGRRS